MTFMRRLSAALLGTAVLVAGLTVVAAPAAAMPGAPGPTPGDGPNTEITMTGTAQGQAVSGALPSDASISDASVAYPAAPPSGHAPYNASFAGIITAQGTTGPTLRMYCIDIHTTTYPGIGYENGSWQESGMPNLGYVARLLNDYYPTTGEPAGAPNNNARAAAVQAAIWYFTDYFVLNANDPIRPLTEAIVNDVRTQPPLPNPTPPSISFTPADLTQTVGQPAGPFTVNTDAPSGVAVSAAGGTLYADAAATIPIPDGTVVQDGRQLWVVPDDPSVPSSVTLGARGQATMPTGNVYIYDGNTPGVTDAQRLILAETAVVTTAVTATAVFAEPALGTLTITKAVAGTSAGQQSAATLHVSCTNGLEQDIAVPAGLTQPLVTTIEDIPVGTVCTVTEPVDGSRGTILVTPSGLGEVTIAEDANALTVTNTVTLELAPTGGSLPWQAGLTAIVLLLLGGGAVLGTRRSTARFSSASTRE